MQMSVLGPGEQKINNGGFIGSKVAHVTLCYTSVAGCISYILVCTQNMQNKAGSICIVHPHSSAIRRAKQTGL